jgi:hypothetical protein
VTGPRFRPRAALGALLVCAATLPLLPGCTLFNRVFHRNGKTSVSCTERPFAGNADTRAPLKVPEGLSAPDTRNAVKIPEVSAAARERPKTQPCLALPPNFFAKPLQPATGKPVVPAPSASPPATPANAPAPPAPPPPAPVVSPQAPSDEVAPPG